MTFYDLGPYMGLIVTVLIAGVAVGVHGVWELVTAKRRLRRAVFANLDSAYENGYFEPGEYLNQADACGVSLDLRAFAPDMFDHSAAQLKPHVQAWLDHKGL